MTAGSSPDPQFHALLEVVEGLRQEVKALQVTVQNMQVAQRGVDSRVIEGKNLSRAGANVDKMAKRVCWECGCNRHLRRDCPYVQGN